LRRVGVLFLRRGTLGEVLVQRGVFLNPLLEVRHDCGIRVDRRVGARLDFARLYRRLGRRLGGSLGGVRTTAASEYGNE
jgi:hypothetical protein